MRRVFLRECQVHIPGGFWDMVLWSDGGDSRSDADWLGHKGQQVPQLRTLLSAAAVNQTLKPYMLWSGFWIFQIIVLIVLYGFNSCKFDLWHMQVNMIIIMKQMELFGNVSLVMWWQLLCDSS